MKTRLGQRAVLFLGYGEACVSHATNQEILNPKGSSSHHKVINGNGSSESQRNLLLETPRCSFSLLVPLRRFPQVSLRRPHRTATMNPSSEDVLSTWSVLCMPRTPRKCLLYTGGCARPPIRSYWYPLLFGKRKSRGSSDRNRILESSREASCLRCSNNFVPSRPHGGQGRTDLTCPRGQSRTLAVVHSPKKTHNFLHEASPPSFARVSCRRWLGRFCLKVFTPSPTLCRSRSTSPFPRAEGI